MLKICNYQIFIKFTMKNANKRYLKKFGRGIRGAPIGGVKFLQYVTV
jgi:hypothetical protein